MVAEQCQRAVQKYIIYSPHGTMMYPDLDQG